MQKLISKYGLAAHLAILAVAPLFLSPSFCLSLALPVFVWILMEPSRVGDESLHEARRRVWRGLLRDPLTWVAVVLVAFALMRWFNGDIHLAYDAERTVWEFSPSRWPILPGVAAGAGAPELGADVAFLVVLIGCRQALGRSARMAFLLLVGFLTGSVALALALGLLHGLPAAEALSACPLEMPDYAGVIFGLILLMEVCVVSFSFERKWGWALLAISVGLVGNAAGLILFAPSLQIASVTAVLLLLLLYAFFYLHRGLRGSASFRMVVVTLLLLVIAAITVVAVLPESVLKPRVEPFKTGQFLSSEFVARREALSGVSQKGWKMSPWKGLGLGTFPSALKYHATDADWAVVPPETQAPLNAYWQVLAERGLVGLVLLALPLGFLFVTYVRRLVGSFRCRSWPHPTCLAGLLTLLLAAAAGFADVTLLHPGVLPLVAAFFALAARSFAKEHAHG